MPLIELFNDAEYATVDPEDYEYLKQFQWRIANGYARRGRNISMHREIMQPPKGMFVDHKNGNRLDNRRANLRICSLKENSRNRNPLKRTCSSKYKGVCFHKHHKRWFARIIVDQKQIFLGYFDNEETAALAYNDAAIQYYGEFARLNEMVVTP